MEIHPVTSISVMTCRLPQHLNAHRGAVLYDPEFNRLANGAHPINDFGLDFAATLQLQPATACYGGTHGRCTTHSPKWRRAHA